MGGTIIAIIITLCVVAPVTWLIAVAYRKKVYESKIGKAEEKSREIIDEALKVAETKKREALLEAKEESMKTKNDLEKEVRERRAEIQRYERRVLNKEENLEKRSEALEKKESSLVSKEEALLKKRKEVEELFNKEVQELERISGFTSEQAKEYLLKTVENDVKHDTAKLVKELEAKAKEEAGKKAKEYVVNAIQKCAADHVAESTISVVQLPNDEMKGRIIGREGRNIRTLETLTGVDLIIDDTPEAVILSGFDPIRREVARIALEKLILDGRIHPARIEEMVEKAQKEVETMIREEGEAAVLEVGLHGIHPELVRLLGKMRFRTSYGQNALKHSIEVAHLSGLLAAEIGVDGLCYIEINPIYEETTSATVERRWYVTPTSAGALWVEKQPWGAIVHGEPGASFDWLVGSVQRGFEGVYAEINTDRYPGTAYQPGDGLNDAVLREVFDPLADDATDYLDESDYYTIFEEALAS